MADRYPFTADQVRARHQILVDMENASYKCAGLLAGALQAHDAGGLQLDPRLVARIRPAVDELISAIAAYQAENIITKARTE